MRGIIRACGTKAITIQVTDFQQYYGPLEEVEDLIKPFLDTEYISRTAILVTFEIDFSRYSGEIKGLKRYYATEIKIDDTIII
jgi:hypothetical protein